MSGETANSGEGYSATSPLSAAMRPSSGPNYSAARLCRGYVEPSRRYAGNQPALSVGGSRPVIGGLLFARRMFEAPALKQFVREERLPGPQVETDDALLDYARRNGSTCHHASCTCVIGRHAMGGRR